MAYIKIFPIKVTDKKALDYIMNPDKTEEKLLISSFACSPESADLEFAFTREEYQSRYHEFMLKCFERHRIKIAKYNPHPVK